MTFCAFNASFSERARAYIAAFATVYTELWFYYFGPRRRTENVVRITNEAVANMRCKKKNNRMMKNSVTRDVAIWMGEVTIGDPCQREQVQAGLVLVEG